MSPTARTLCLLALLLAGCGPSDRIRGRRPPGAPGQSAAALLAGDRYDELVVRVDHQPGAAPSAAALDALAQLLRERCHKARGVRIEVGPPIPGSLSAEHTEADLERFDLLLPAPRALPGRVVLRVLYLRGRSALDASRGEAHLGLAFAPRALAVFKDQLQPHLHPLATVDELEAAVLGHEVGHLLGLVGLGAPVTRPHADRSHPGHCSQAPCLMNARSSAWGPLGLISPTLGGSAPAYCGDCLADLRAAGGR